MGLFDSVFGGMAATKPFDAREAFAGILLGASACDGHIADEEAQGLFTIVARMQLYQNVNGQQFNSMMDRLLGVLKREGPDGLIKRAVEGLPQELRETAFANACDLVLADGRVEEAEKEFLQSLTRALGISGDQALTIVQVMIVKNRG